MRVECPKCGNTEKVEYLGESASSGCYAEFERDYYCGECHTTFCATFELTKTVIAEF
jgi:ribosomal protein S27AE